MSPHKPIQFAKELRRASTDAEQALWQHLRGRRLNGFKFRRQHPVEGFILDFYCPQAGLAIELDGGGHAEPLQAKRDRERTEALERAGVTVLRFWNDEVLRQRSTVLEEILRHPRSRVGT